MNTQLFDRLVRSESAVNMANDLPVVVFSHGKESGPNGKKMLALAEVAQKNQMQIIQPDYRGIEDPVNRTIHLLTEVSDVKGPFLLVGSSMGGYVSIQASRCLPTIGLFLMSPAISIKRYPHNKSEPGCKGREVVIIHAWQDDIVPVQPIIEYSSNYKTQLHLLNSDHRLTGQIPLLCMLFDDFLKSFRKGHNNGP